MSIGGWDEATLARFIDDRLADADPQLRAWRSLCMRLAAPGTRAIAFGTATLTFTASTFTPVTTVAHGLKNAQGVGIVPVVALATSQHSLQAWVTAIPTDATNISLQGWSPTAISSSQAVYWLAIG